jgi:hypothetical protein
MTAEKVNLAKENPFVPTKLEQKNLLDKLYSCTFLDRFATYPCKKHLKSPKQ